MTGSAGRLQGLGRAVRAARAGGARRARRAGRPRQRAGSPTTSSRGGTRGGHAPFSLSWLAAVGERTERVVLGTSVLTPTFRYNPAVLAQAFGTLGLLYPGRVVLGVGTGEALNEIAVGLRWSGRSSRSASPGCARRSG